MLLNSKPECAEGAEVTSAPRQPWSVRLTEIIIGAAIEVHRRTGPGLLESAYEECLCFELRQAGLSHHRQVELPIIYKGMKLDCGYRMDLLVEDLVVVELKTVERLLPVHSAQLLTYLKLSGKKIGLLLNFNEPVLRRGIKRLVNHFEDAIPSAPSALEPRDAEQTRSDVDPRSSCVPPRLCASAVKKERQ